ncbi:MAG: PqqD family protein [Candidatus Omnitrophica bacterium]|nr:PqqD family protein [Candidatus Omnitrophota bacterium]
MDNKKVFKRNPDFVMREIDKETILVPVIKTSEDINCIYTLNKVGSEVWRLIDGKNSLENIKRKVLENFDTTPKEVEKEMKGFLKDLEEIKAIK